MAESAQQYFDKYQGQSLLYNTKDASLRGQCVQAICFYVQDNLDPVEWADAYYWKNLANQYPDKYQWIDNTPSAVPQPNDIIIWLPSLPGSGGGGHIAACLQATPGTGVFISVDSNWGGKTVHKVTHNYSYVAGWLRFKGAAAPAPATPAVAEGDEVIPDQDNYFGRWSKTFMMIRGRSPSREEFQKNAVGLTWLHALEILEDDPEADTAERAQELGQTIQPQLDTMQGTINNQNATITDLTTKLQDSNTTAAQKQEALTTALAQIAKDNADLATAHDQIADLQKDPVVKAEIAAKAATQKPSKISTLLASLMSAASKFKLSSLKSKK